MVYKYQIETLEYLRELVGRLEKLTEDKMSLRIGYCRGEFLNSRGTDYYVHKGDLYLRINYGDCFSIFDGDLGSQSFHYVDDDSDKYFKFVSNLFIKLNEWIDEIYKNKHEREQFHDNLNHELRALNKALDKSIGDNE